MRLRHRGETFPAARRPATETVRNEGINLPNWIAIINTESYTTVIMN